MSFFEKNHDTYDNNLKTLFEGLDALEFPKDEYVIVGSGPLGIRGIREVHDLDIVVSDRLWKKLSEKYEILDGDPGTKKMYIPTSIEILGGPSFISDGQTPTVEEMIKGAEFINGYPFMTLQYTIFFKLRRGREKDLRDLLLIEDWMGNNTPR